MDGHRTSVQPAHPVLHTLVPSLPVRDRDDARFRVRNYRASMRACPQCWQVYFETLAEGIRREWN
jgi:hypothetical protein